MAHVFIDEDTAKEIIKRLYKREYVAGLICELCWLRNFRVGDVRHAKVSHFKMDNGYPEFYLCYDKMKSNEWYPISKGIYNKIIAHIQENNYEYDDSVFKIKMQQKGRYYTHEGVITHEWMQRLWFRICKEVGIYTETLKEWRECYRCKYKVGKLKCSFLGSDNIKQRNFIDIKHCIALGNTKKYFEHHPRLHESLRGSGAQYKVRYYMEHCKNCGELIFKYPICLNKRCSKCGTKGYTYEEALLRVFHTSNWKSYKVFKGYIDMAFEKDIGNRIYVDDWVNKELI